MDFFFKLNIYLSDDTTIPLLGINPEVMEAHVHTKPWARLSTAPLRVTAPDLGWGRPVIYQRVDGVTLLSAGKGMNCDRRDLDGAQNTPAEGGAAEEPTLCDFTCVEPPQMWADLEGPRTGGCVWNEVGGPEAWGQTT